MTPPVIKLPENAKILPGDHVRVRIRLTREQLTAWPKLRAGVLAMAQTEGWGAILGPGLELITTDAPSASQNTQFLRAKPHPKDVLSRFAEQHTVSREMADVGSAILEEAIR